MDYLNHLFLEYHFSPFTAAVISYTLILVCMILLSFFGNFLTHKAFLKMIAPGASPPKIDWGQIMLKKNVFRYLSACVSTFILYSLSPALSIFGNWFERIFLSLTVVLAVFVSSALLNAINEIYGNYSISKLKPIKGYIQVLKIVLYFIGGVISISILIDKSPLYFLSGIGALTAIFLLIFKDSLLGLVAGISLSSNDMVRLGDWIEMPKYNADGNVIEISLNTVKVQNFDKTITTIPTYALLSDSFKNWRGMVESGGRRLKRSVFIDTTSITFCTDEMIARFKKIHYLKDYIHTKEIEIREYNQKYSADPTELTNGRRLTNIGTFRAYIENYLKNHPKIRQDFTLLVRQLPSGEHGLPLEIYAFTTDTEWAKHEAVQSDVFDHIFAVVPQFGLRIFQGPSGFDMRTV